MSKNKKIIFISLIIVIIILAWWFLGKPAVPYCKITNPLHCENDNDCICVDAENPQQGGCFLGNKSYYEKCADKSTGCFDFCSGWGQPPVKCIQNKCTNDYKIEEVTVATDKTEYRTDENISFTVTNNSAKNILVSACPQGEGFVEIEEKINGKWEPRSVSPLCDALCAGPYTLKPNEKHIYSQREFFTCIDTLLPLNPPGDYRIKFGYATKLPYSGNRNWTYSNLFAIKSECPKGERLWSCKTRPCCCPINAKCD